MNNRELEIRVEQCQKDINKLEEEKIRINKKLKENTLPQCTLPMFAFAGGMQASGVYSYGCISFVATPRVVDYINEHKGDIIYISPSDCTKDGLDLSYDFIDVCVPYKRMTHRFYKK